MCWNRDLKTHSKLFLFLHFQRKWKTKLFFKCFRISIFLAKILVLNHRCFSTFRQQYCFSSSASSYPNCSFFYTLKYIFLSLSRGLSPKWKLLTFWSAFLPIFRSFSASSSPRNRVQRNGDGAALWLVDAPWAWLGWGWVRDGEARALDRLFESENVVANQFFSR